MTNHNTFCEHQIFNQSRKFRFKYREVNKTTIWTIQENLLSGMFLR